MPKISTKNPKSSKMENFEKKLNNPIMDTCMALGTSRNATKAVFRFFLEMCIFYLRSAKIRYFCEATIEMEF
jgi:hypothetical protein